MGTTNAGGSSAPQQVMAVVNGLVDFCDALDDYIKASSNMFSPEMVHLRDMDSHIATYAATLGQTEVDKLEADVPAALTALQTQITSAKTTIAQMKTVQSVLSVVSAVLSVAANISTGNPLGSAQAVLSLAQTISSALSAIS
jgi:hypothetical protein